MNMTISVLFVLLLCVQITHTYENEGRLHSQHRVFPSGEKTAPVHYYCDDDVKLCATDLKGIIFEFFVQKNIIRCLIRCIVRMKERASELSDPKKSALFLVC